MTRNELKRIGSQLGINCGGVGGTPGPCKTKADADSYSRKANELSDKAEESGDTADHLAAQKAHDEAADAHYNHGNEKKADRHVATAHDHYLATKRR